MKHPKNKQLSSESQFSVLPTIESAGNTLPPGLVLDPDADGGILTFIDREHYGGVHTVESGHTYTIRLGLHRKLEKAALDEHTIIRCSIPGKAAAEQCITALFFAPEASVQFMDTVVLTSVCRFSLKYVIGSAVLENYHNPCGLPLSREAVRIEASQTIIFQNQLRKAVPNHRYQGYCDVLRFHVDVLSEK